jgi:two-component system nitrogen regulation response regulator NtrX
LDPSVLPVLDRYDWPGNVRELRNVIERMAILTSADRLTAESIPVEIREPIIPRTSGLQETRDAAERDRILSALDATSWNVTRAAQVLGVERTNLHKRIRALNLSRTR